MNPAERAELRRLTEAATPGPWFVEPGGLERSDAPAFIHNNGSTVAHAEEYADLEFIAAANPTTIKKLLTKIEELEQALKFQTDRLCVVEKEFADQQDEQETREAYNQLVKERDALRAFAKGVPHIERHPLERLEIVVSEHVATFRSIWCAEKGGKCATPKEDK